MRRSLVVAALVALPSPLAAQWSLVERDAWSLELGGYVRALTAVHDLGYDASTLDRQSAFNGQVVRLKWTARGQGWFLEVHDRFQGTVSSAGAGGGPAVGFGVSAVPDRTVDLESTLLEGERYRVWHDLDRLALTLYTRAADVTLGRQAITWGISSLFPVADLWARFSPFELDTEEKPGIDAVRVLAYPGEGVELDVVVADRGSARNLSAGARVTWSLGEADLYGAAAKLWREAIVMVGATYLLDEVSLRAEAAFPYDVDDQAGDTPRVTAGAAWLRGSWALTGELHLNGIGASDPGGYPKLLLDPRLARGETYHLGRWMGGAAVGYSSTDRLALSLVWLANLSDHSAALMPGLVYDFGQNARVSLGGLVSAGDEPVFPFGIPVLKSEFGAYGSLGWTQVSVYF
ncbi:MAG TPA: hypothetical protein VGA70_14185 [Longimicrobiales bacterium]|jgi:hypothetical protein